MSQPHEARSSLSSSQVSQKAWSDLEGLGYDIGALKRMNMNDNQVVQLRDKAFRYRGIQVQEKNEHLL
jgi:hypothetical protein